MEEPQTIEASLVFPAGDYAKVEMMGHRTLWGRVTEVEKFGVKMCQIEPICGGQLLAPILTGGASIYCLTPVSAVTAFGMAPKSPGWGTETLKLLAAPAEAIKDEHPVEHVPSALVDAPTEFVEWLKQVAEGCCFTDVENFAHLADVRSWFDAGMTVEAAAEKFNDEIPF